MSDKLFHYGVKGMRWGFRKSDSGGSAKPTGKRQKAPQSEDSARAAGTVKKQRESGITSLSNDELRGAIERLNLEQNYTRLTSTPSNSTKVDRGARYIGSFVGGVFNTQVTAAANSVARHQINTAMQKAGLVGKPKN